MAKKKKKSIPYSQSSIHSLKCFVSITLESHFLKCLGDDLSQLFLFRGKDETDKHDKMRHQRRLFGRPCTHISLSRGRLAKANARMLFSLSFSVMMLGLEEAQRHLLITLLQFRGGHCERSRGRFCTIFFF